MKRLRRSVVAAVGCLLAGGVLAVVPSVATHPATALNVSESVLMVALGTSLPDVGTAASLVAAGKGDGVVLAEAVDELGPGAASIIADQQPDRIVVVGGRAAVGPDVENELRALAAGVDIDRLAGNDRIQTAALAAARTLPGSGSVTVVLANGWSLPDVGAAASAVASGAADAVLYSSRDALGEPTRQVLASHRPVRMLVAGGPAAVSQDVLTSATGSAGVVLTGRLGGSTRVETATLVAQRALDGGATTAVIANGWSLPDVGIAAGLAAALPDSVVLYTEPESLGAATETALTEHTIKHVFLVGAVDADTTHLMSLVPSKFPLTRITEAAHASLHALGAAAPASQPRLVAISAASSFTCGIGLDGTAACWGNDGRNDATAPAGSYSSLSVGQNNSCGLRLDGTVSCWLFDGRDGPAAPSGVFAAVSVGSANSCGLRPGGTVECWGSTYSGANDAPAGSFTEVSVGRDHACGLRPGGTIECWGADDGGETMAPAGAFVSVAAASSGDDSCGIRPNGTVECWGRRYQGDHPFEVPSGEFRSVVPNVNHACGIRMDSSVACWGTSYSGQLNAPHGAYRAVSLGYQHTCGLRLDSTVACWGENVRGQLDVPQRVDAPRLAPRLSSDAASVVGIDTPFEVDVKFPLAVSGLEVDDFDVVNGDATALEGSGVSYRVTVVATSPGTVVIRVPEQVAHDRFGYGTERSQALAVTVTDGGSAATVGFDTWDRDAALAAYRGEFRREEPDWGYSGNVADCVAGTTSQAFRDSVIQRVNWYRRMAGLGTITEHKEHSRTAQHAALMMAANGMLSHSPASDWKCYSATGATGAGSSNLYLGISGLRAIDGYIRDPGGSNVAVGHRRWILLPQLTTVGTGDVPFEQGVRPASNALYVFAPRASTREVREQRGFVAWPPAGFVPSEAVWGRWSFAVAALESQCSQRYLWQCSPDFSAATVAMSDDDGVVGTEVISAPALLGDAAIVWAVDGDTNSGQHPEPSGGDHCYNITISGVRVDGVAQDPYEYATCVLGPDAEA